MANTPLVTKTYTTDSTGDAVVKIQSGSDETVLKRSEVLKERDEIRDRIVSESTGGGKTVEGA